MMFPPGWNNGYAGRDDDWHTGISLWSQDFPAADRHFSLAVRRLSRVHARSVEQVVNLDDGDEVFNWPWLYAVQVGEWGITDSQAAKLRDYLPARRILHGRRFSRRHRMGRFSGIHAPRLSRPPDRRNRRQGPDLSHRLRSRRQNPDSRPGDIFGEGYKNSTRIRRPLARHLRRPRPRDDRRSPSTPTSATPGNTPTTRTIPKNSPAWPSASA